MVDAVGSEKAKQSALHYITALHTNSHVFSHHTTISLLRDPPITYNYGNDFLKNLFCCLKVKKCEFMFSVDFSTIAW